MWTFIFMDHALSFIMALDLLHHLASNGSLMLERSTEHNCVCTCIHSLVCFKRNRYRWCRANHCKKKCDWNRGDQTRTLDCVRVCAVIGVIVAGIFSSRFFCSFPLSTRPLAFFDGDWYRRFMPRTRFESFQFAITVYTADRSDVRYSAKYSTKWYAWNEKHWCRCNQ